jgi:hypothetical protein
VKPNTVKVLGSKPEIDLKLSVVQAEFLKSDDTLIKHETMMLSEYKTELLNVSRPAARLLTNLANQLNRSTHVRVGRILQTMNFQSIAFSVKDGVQQY